MDLFIQLGHGMMGHAKELNSAWGESTSIFSPKNNTLDQMISLSSNLTENNGSILIDPQFYIPRTSQENLHSHSFWPQNFDTSLFFSGTGIEKMLLELQDNYVNNLNASGFIIPTLYLSEVNENWENITEIIMAKVQEIGITVPKYLNVCISSEILLNEENTHKLIEILENYDVDGFYIIPIHPNDDYLIDNATWMINLLDIIASLKSLKKKIILGYSNHQQLIMALAKVDAISAGTWLKTRMFPLGDFDENDDETGGGRRSTWYYCPQTLSEYQIQFLDVANRVGVLSEMKTPNQYNSGYTDILFSGAQPSTVNFSEREAFRHYLQCLKTQCQMVSKPSYEETKNNLKLLFETALDLGTFFHGNGVRAKHRDFQNVAESTLSVIDAFDNSWGLKMQANWNLL